MRLTKMIKSVKSLRNYEKEILDYVEYFKVKKQN